MNDPGSNSFMQFFMGDKEINNINFDASKNLSSTVKTNENFESEKVNSVTTTEPSNFLKIVQENSENPKIKEFEKLVLSSNKPPTPTESTTDFNGIDELQKINANDFPSSSPETVAKFPDFNDMISSEKTPFDSEVTGSPFRLTL